MYNDFPKLILIRMYLYILRIVCKKIVICSLNKLYLLSFKRSITYFKRKITISNFIKYFTIT